MNHRGFALATVLLIVIVVPIAVFGITFFITNTITRYDAQTRSAKALYLAQAGIHKAIFGIESSGAVPTVPDWDAKNKIILTHVDFPACNVYRLTCTGTSIASSNPADQISRTLFAQYDATANKINLYLEGDGTGIPLPTCCNQIWWPFNDGGGYSAVTSPASSDVGALTPANSNAPDWVADRYGAPGRALAFNSGSQVNYVLVSDSSGLDLTTEGTLMAWVWINTTVVRAGVIHKGGSSNATEDYALLLDRQNSGSSRVQIVINGVTVYEGNYNVSRRVWHHVAGSWGPNGMRIYVDGQFVGRSTTYPTARTNSQPLYIGTAVTSGTQFEGTIDEVYVNRCQKTDQEILDYYNETKP